MKTYFCLVTNQDKSKFRKCRPTLFIVQPPKRNNPILFTAHTQRAIVLLRQFTERFDGFFKYYFIITALTEIAKNT